MVKAFPVGVAEKMGSYVYLLEDPRNNQIFYVGKGKGNRVFQHVEAAIETPIVSDKLDLIREITVQGCEVKYTILRHGLTDEAVFEVESALIDFIGLKALTNQIRGMDTDERGQMTVQEIITKYEAPEADLDALRGQAILVIVNRLYRRDMSPDEIYQITRGSWVIGRKRKAMRYAFAVYRGVIRGVFEIHRWEPIVTSESHQKRRNRWRFEGVPTLEHFVGQNVVKYLKPKAQNPIQYIE